MTTLVVRTAIPTDKQGNYLKTGGCPPCHSFVENGLKYVITTLASRPLCSGPVRLNQESIESELNPMTPKALEDVEVYFPQVFLFNTEEWERASRNPSKMITPLRFEIYNGKKDSKGNWESDDKPLDGKSIIDWIAKESPKLKREATKATRSIEPPPKRRRAGYKVVANPSQPF